MALVLKELYCSIQIMCFYNNITTRAFQVNLKSRGSQGQRLFTILATVLVGIEFTPCFSKSSVKALRELYVVYFLQTQHLKTWS